jgi:hypothetical protein
MANYLGITTHANDGRINEKQEIPSKIKKLQYPTESTLSITQLSVPLLPFWGTRWRSWSRNCVTSLKVAGSILDGVIGIFH